MHDGRHARGSTSTLEFEDVITVDLPDDGYVDREYLREVFRDPHNYLPLRRKRTRDLEDLPREVESLLARRAKQTGLLTAVSALICAVVAAAVLAERPTRNDSAGADRQRSVNGIAALGTFTVTRAERLGSVGTTPEKPARPQSARVPADDSDRPANSAAPDDSHNGDTPSTAGERTAESSPDSSESAEDSDATTSDESDTARDHSARVAGSSSRDAPRQPDKVATVREFYQRVTSSPDRATRLLAPGLLTDGLGQLRTAWRSLETVHLLDVSERPDGSVRAVLSMRRSDGTLIHVTQLFGFASGGLIDHVQLLSAQHS